MSDSTGNGWKPTRRQLVGTGMAALAAVQAGPVLAAPAIAGRKRPNILFVMTDQERSATTLPSGLDLPAHEWIGERGTFFAKYNVNTTPCSPSRSVAYFGRHTQQTDMVVNDGAPPFPRLNGKLRSIGHHLRDLGYYTAYKGKWHLSDIPHAAQLGYGPYIKTDRSLEPYGFSDYNIDGDPHGKVWDGYRYDGPTVSSAIQWLDEVARKLPAEQPWFLAVNLVNPHDICFFEAWQGQTATRGNPDVLSPLAPAPASEIYDRDWSDLPLPASFYRKPAEGEPWAVNSYRKVCDLTYGAMPDDERVWRRNQSYYFNCIRDASYKVRRLFSALETLGLADDTIVVLTADHGEMAGAQRLRQKGPVIFKENVAVPLYISHPDARKARTVDSLGSTVDLLPTLYEFAGGKPGELEDPLGKLPGVSLANALTGGRTERDERGAFYNYGVPFYIDPQMIEGMMRNARTPSAWTMLIESLKLGHLGPSRTNRGLHRGVFDGRYKFARFFGLGEHHMPRDWETLRAHNDLALYDTATDPDELQNLALEPEAHKELILALNARTNALIETEVGRDEGQEFVGPGWLYRL
ncbi:MAG: sulfatase-like hydrolase/transferase [Parvibaculum sp.]|uniref:sulfatase-like hydrolase/transferase n=1 Tax=Parvibaculum sp. TaxID=2024848 RepID=UPI003C760844